MKRILPGVLFLFLAGTIIPVSALAANYVKPDVFKQWLDTGKSLVIVDIQPAEDFAMHHFKGSIETNAFPAKSGEEKKRIDKALPTIRSCNDNVVIACPKGKGGAGNTYDYLMSQSVAENRLFILEGGIADWPYPNLFVKGK